MERVIVKKAERKERAYVVEEKSKIILKLVEESERKDK
jgi:hypothetical protein